MPAHQIPMTSDGAIAGKAQRNFTDADSRIMKTGEGFVQGSNAQAAVDDVAQIVVAVGVSNQSPDCQHLVPMVDRIVDNCGRAPERLSADNGYLSQSNLDRLAARGIDAYIAPGRVAHSTSGKPSASSDTIRGAKARMKAKLATDEGHAVYARRKVIVEPSMTPPCTMRRAPSSLQAMASARAD